MTRIPSSRSVLNRWHDERGIVMPATLAVLVVTTMIGMVAVQAGVVSSHQTFRDSSTKRSVAAAAAGMKAAIYETNMVQPAASECVRRDATTGALTKITVGANGWCPEQVVEDLGSNASYSAVVSSASDVTIDGAVVERRKVVSTGTVNGVKRRVAAYITSATGAPIFASGTAVRSHNAIDFKNTVRVVGGIGSNGSIKLQNEAEICGNALAGPGKSVTFQNTAHLCPGYTSGSSSSVFSVPTVDQGNAPTINDNGRIGGADVFTDSPQSLWNPATRVLDLKNDSTLTLTGDIYSFCSLTIQNDAQLIIAPRAPGTAIRIYIDSPENCGGSGGSVILKNNGAIVNQNAAPTTLQLYIMGSPSIFTQVLFENSFSPDVNMVINAPNSTVHLKNDTHIVGAVQAKSVKMENSTEVRWHEDAGTLQSASVFRVYHRQEWIDCASDPTGSLPDSGC